MGEKALLGTLPLVGTDIAKNWDALYIFLFWLSVFFFVLVMGILGYAVLKHRASKGHKSAYIHGNVPLEVIWTVVPTVLLLIIFWWGYAVYKDMITAPSDAMEIRVVGKQWMWNFYYDDGRTTTGDLFVPVNKPVKLIMSSEDVLHSFFIPNFRVKQDTVPGMYTTVWFEAAVTGMHQIYCAEYCGTAHSGMLGRLIALNAEDWKAWKAEKKIDLTKYGITDGVAISSAAASGDAKPTAKLTSVAEQGKKLMQLKGCVACHSDDGSARIGPTYKGAFGRQVEFVDGTKTTADENYLRESIENPTAKVVKGFNPVMPTYKGQLTEEETNALIAYIKSLK